MSRATTTGGDGDFTARVVVVAGTLAVLEDVASALVTAGAFVAFVGNRRPASDVAAAFVADAVDPAVWARVIPHVEQRLGPIDAVVCDPAAASAAMAATEVDLRRRGRPDVVVAAADDDAAAVLSRLAGKR